MNKAYEEIQRLVKVNALHRKGFRLGEMTERKIILHAASELNELYEATDDENALEEMADVFGCLFHVAIRRKFTLGMIEEKLLKKLKARLSE